MMNILNIPKLCPWKPKLIIYNSFYNHLGDKHVNKLSLKLLQDGNIHMYIGNGENKETGYKKQCAFMLTKENKEILKKWLDSA